MSEKPVNSMDDSIFIKTREQIREEFKKMYGEDIEEALKKLKEEDNTK